MGDQCRCCRWVQDACICYRHGDIRIRLLNESETRILEPGLQFGEIAAGSFTQIDGHVEPKKVIDACLDHVRRHGGVVHSNCRVTGLYKGGEVRERDEISVVSTECGRFNADHVVLATGADTPELAATADLRVPLDHSFGATIVTEPTESIFQNVGVVHTPHEVDPQINIRQLQDGSVMVHGGSHGGLTDGSLGRTDADVETVFLAAANYIPVLADVRIKDVLRGRRPLPEDGLPIIGYANEVPNLYLAAMHSGVTLAALVGEYAALEILNDCRIDVLKPYRLERFGVQAVD